jgi:DNA-binding transcriptional regulator GbsR (MarR family)
MLPGPTNPDPEKPLEQDTAAARDAAPDALRASEAAVSDAIGRLMQFWGFKRNMGRVWAVLYLSERPLTAQDLRERLQLSTGAVSMTVTELLRWGVVKKLWVQGERREHFAAEGNLWKMISRVLREREQAEIADTITAMEDALRAIDVHTRAADPEVRARALVQRERIGQLLELARLGRQLLDALVSTARLDASALTRFLLGSSR